MRYHPHTDDEIGEMLQVAEVGSLDDLFAPIPDNLKLNRVLELPSALDEIALDDHLNRLAESNRDGRKTSSFAGAGVYEHYVPHAVRQLIQRSEYLTAYTPYQPEISQGTLKVLFEYQTMMAEILGLDVANASMYDGAQATAEAALMAMRVKRRQSAVICSSVHPQYVEVMRTYLRHTAEILPTVALTDAGVTDVVELQRLLESSKDIACVVLQTPNAFGCVENVQQVAQLCEQNGVLLVVAFNEPLAFALLKPPGQLGADIAAGEAISLGSAMGLGGPSLGVFAARQQFVRQMPGRLSGKTVDSSGREGYVLTLSTREQHIRRARATSNICTNQGLCATATAIYLSLLGKQGFTELAKVNLSKAEYAKKRLTSLPGIELRYPTPTFNEFTLTLPVAADELTKACVDLGVLPGVSLAPWDEQRSSELLVAVTEVHTKQAIDRMVDTVEKVLS